MTVQRKYAMSNPRAARADPELATAPPVVRTGVVVAVGPTGVAVALDPALDAPPAPPVETVPLDEGAGDPVPVARMAEDGVLDAGADVLEELAAIMEVDSVLDGQYVVVYDVV